jgi:hypothetical protein
MSLSPQTIHLLNSFNSEVEDRHAQNVLLHAIFTRIVKHDLHTSQHAELFKQVCMTLARLYWDQYWDPARVFFYILTGFLLPDDTVILSKSSFPELDDNLTLNAEVINGVCDLHAEAFNGLWYNFEEDEEEEEDETEEEEGEDSDEQ